MTTTRPSSSAVSRAAKTAREWAEVLREAGREAEAFRLMDEVMMLSLRQYGERKRREANETNTKRGRRAR